MTPPASLIEQVRLRPGLYFGCKSLTAFYHYYLGYRTACVYHRIDAHPFDLKIPDDFHDWAAYRTHYRESTSGWCNMIVQTSPSEEAAFDRFFELLDEHAQRTPHLIAEIIAPISTTSRLLNPLTREEAHLPAPAKVQLVKYNDHDPGFFALYDSPDWRDQFHPYLSWMRGLRDGEWIIHDPPAYQQMLREDEEYQRERDSDFV
jgi:hypothetical protein